MAKTQYVLQLPVAASTFHKSGNPGFIVELGQTHCFVDESTFHKLFVDLGKVQKAYPSSVESTEEAIPLDLDPALLEGREGWQVRVIVEAHLLNQKVEDLNEFIKSDDFDSLGEDQQELLLNQLGAMQDYEKALLERVKTFE